MFNIKILNFLFSEYENRVSRVTFCEVILSTCKFVAACFVLRDVCPLSTMRAC